MATTQTQGTAGNQGIENALNGNADQMPEQDMSTQEQDVAERRRMNARTEAEAQSIDGRAGQSGKSSHDHMGHVKASTGEGAGGGAKSKRHH